MTTWPDEGHDSDLDVMDPTAGIGGLGEADTTTAPAEGSDDPTADPTGETRASTVDEDWSAADVPEGSTEHDFLDVLRIWLTPDDRRLAKIRISNRWRQRLKKRPLASAVVAALKLGQKDAGTGRRDPRITVERPQTTERVDQAFLDRWVETMQSVGERMAELKADPDPAAGRGRWVGRPTVGRSRGGTVEVTLGRGARTSGITMDASWLAEARVSEVCDAVQQAHDAAYAEFVEPEYEPGEYDELSARLAGFGAEVLSRADNHARGAR